MPPIPIYSDSPIAPKRPDGITPQTASSDQQQQPPSPTRTTALPATNTTAASFPPAPQPGAVPYPSAQPGARPPAPTGTSSKPPPPQPGAIPTVTATVTQTSTIQAPRLPPQFSIPAPENNFAATKSTDPHAAFAATTFTSSHPPPPTSLPGPPTNQPENQSSVGEAGRQRAYSIEHPPGYVQNPYAADGTAADRARLEEAARADREENGVMGSVRSFLGDVGEKLGKAEGEAWKWVGGK